MDPSHVAMVDFEWPKTIFEEYVCDEPTKLCINISEMLKLLRRVGGDESINLELEEKTARLKMTLKSKYTRVFRMATLEPSTEEVPTPKISFNSTVKITTTCMRNAVDDAATVSDHIQFETADDTFIIKASGDLGSVTIDVGKESEEILGYARCLHELGQPQSAAEVIGQLLALDPTDPLHLKDLFADDC